jgi:hypothetical protein
MSNINIFLSLLQNDSVAPISLLLSECYRPPNFVFIGCVCDYIEISNLAFEELKIELLLLLLLLSLLLLFNE